MAKSKENTAVKESERARFALYTDQATLDLVDKHYKEDGCGCKSEYIAKAIHYYTELHALKDCSNVIPDIITSTLKDITRESDNRQGRLLFKMAVELTILQNIIAAKDIKDLVDSIVDDLAKDDTISELYDLWYDLKYEILGMYSGKRPPKIPLSENKEFRSIKNSIIKEASSPNYDPNVKVHSYPKGNRVSATTVTRLFKNLCNIFRDKFDDENRRTIYTPAVDKRIRREDEAKRNAELIYD